MRARLGTLYSRAVSRFVSQVHCRLPAETEKQLFLTFDDGPTLEGTPELLEVLSEYDVRATFFLVGENAARHPEHVRELVARGHAIGNHTFTHADAWKLSTRQLLRELVQCTRVLETITESNIGWMRPPFGRVTRPMVRWCRRWKQQLLLWDVMPPDFEVGVSQRRVCDTFLRGVRTGSVICMHDNAKSRRVTPNSLRECLPRLLSDGWQFTTP